MTRLSFAASFALARCAWVSRPRTDFGPKVSCSLLDGRPPVAVVARSGDRPQLLGDLR